MIALLEIFNFSARKQRRAAFAFPSTAGARSLILIALSCSPTTLALFAFGTTWNRKVAIELRANRSRYVMRVTYWSLTTNVNRQLCAHVPSLDRRFRLHAWRL